MTADRVAVFVPWLAVGLAGALLLCSGRVAAALLRSILARRRLLRAMDGRRRRYYVG